MKNGSFDEKIVLITGAGRGIGRELARAFAGSGARVIANYNSSEKEAEALKRELAEEGYEIDLMRADVSNNDDVENMLDKITEKYNRIDVLVNNAGIRRDIFLAMMSEEDWDSVIDVNLKGLYFMCKWVSRIMIGRRKGKIINITSVSAFKGVAGQTNYSASKGGIVSFTRSLAVELAPYGINVNAVAPGLIETDMVKDLDDKKPMFLKKIPLGRLGKPEDVSGGVLFLASDAADYISGQVIAIDGGLS